MPDLQSNLRRYLAIPAGEQRLKILEDNLTRMIQEMVKEEPADLQIHLPLPAVLLDVVREIRVLRGDASSDHSTSSAVDAVESQLPFKPEVIDMEGNAL